MSDAVTTVSVRGEAERTVAPDLGRLHAQVRAVEATKADALRVAADALRAVLTELERLGGAALSGDGERRALGWIAHSVSTWDEYEYGEQGRVATGRFGAAVTVPITVRDFALLAPVGQSLAGQPLLQLDSVGWDVDSDNPAWPRVRAAAIEAAVAKARDYATALGGSLQHIDHVADAGLLGGAGGRESMGRVFKGEAYAASAEDGAAPSLDPLPQTLTAVIEVRFTASVAPLTSPPPR